MSDLVKQLRDSAWAKSSNLEMETADRIADLERQLAEAKASAAKWEADARYREGLLSKLDAVAGEIKGQICAQPTAQQVEDAARWHGFMGAMVAEFNSGALTPVQEAIKAAFSGDDAWMTVEEVGRRVSAAMQAGKELKE